jgi:hypothetical protein
MINLPGYVEVIINNKIILAGQFWELSQAMFIIVWSVVRVVLA